MRTRTRYLINGKEVSRRKFSGHETLCDSSGVPSFRSGDAWRNHYSAAAGVNPVSIADAVEYSKKCGVPTEFNEKGMPKFTSASHQRRFLKTIGMHNADDIAGGPPGKIEKPED